MTTLAEALAPRSDQLNADDLIAGPRTLKITSARISKEDRAVKIVIGYEGDNGKPWKPCKTMGRAMVMAWAITDESQFVGKSVRVFRDPDVSFGKETNIGGIRISHMSDIDKPVHVKLTVSQGKKGMFTFAPLPAGVRQAETEPLYTLAMANADLDNAADLAELETVWKRKIMAPLRASLRHVLDERKAALTPVDDNDPFEPATGRATEDHGDAHDGADQ